MAAGSPERTLLPGHLVAEPLLDGKENQAGGANSPSTQPLPEQRSPASGKGRLEEAAIRRKAEIAASPPMTPSALLKQVDSASISKRSLYAAALGNSRRQLSMENTAISAVEHTGNPLDFSFALQLDDDASVEMLCHKFQALNDALRESNSTQASLQKYLERSLDECERLRAVTVEASKVQSECERLRTLDVEGRKECERLRTLEAEARKECGRLRAVEVEARRTQDECDRLRAVEAEAKKAQAEIERLQALEPQLERLQNECERFKKFEVDARDAHNECKRLWSVEAEARRAQEECERLREVESEARQLRSECEQLRSVETEMRKAQEECERLRDVEAEVRKITSECDRLRAAAMEAKKAQEEIARLKDAEDGFKEIQSECERLRSVEIEARNFEEECKRLQIAEAEAKRSRDHHHHRWCVLDQEREGLQRVAQQAREAEKATRAGEARALEEAAAWRRWLASFLDVLLRRGASGFEDAEVSSSQCLQQRQPKVHMLLSQLSQAADPPAPQPELLSQLRALYGDVSSQISSGQLTVRWGGEHDREVSMEAKNAVEEKTHEAELLEQKLSQKELTVAALEHDKRVLQSELRTLQNTVQELRGSIRVFCRIRPQNRAASGPLAAAGIGARAESTQHVVLKKPPGDRRHEFSFDRVFPPDAGQRTVYEEVGSLLPGVFSGLHLCIFAYGQTGAGKTYTLAGNNISGEKGIQDMAIADLLRLADERAQMGGLQYEARISALEIYNETVKDLLVDASAADSRLEVRQSRDGGNFADSSEPGGGQPGPSQFGSMRVPNLQTRRVQSPADVERALVHVKGSRHVAATCLNEHSSRSHCIVSLSLVQRSAGDSDGMHHSVGVLHIVDLAGSERTKVSQAEGQQMKEANCINRSLSALADVLYALGEGGNTMHVPYRNSKLTYLLQDALGGVGCKTLLFAQVSPESPDVHETYSTLAFASRVANVQKGRLRPNTPSAAKKRDTTPPPSAGRAQATRNSVQPLPDASPVSQASDSVIETSLLSPIPAGRALPSSASNVAPVAGRSGSQDSTPRRK